MWHIFPQYVDLDSGRQSCFFGIIENAEAACYLARPVLGKRLHKIATALLANKDRQINEFFEESDKKGVVVYDFIRECLSMRCLHRSVGYVL